ncbi:MAG TPA: hypothetical protein VJR71_01375 [Pseudolabrys sp.]|nr:hypothetical protein [Pseudolabrys sp.]
MIGRTQAAAIAPQGLRLPANEFAAVDKVQFVYRGRRYCWYWDAWHGPGWYWCGYEWRRGFGWGGPSGWRGWRRPVHHRPPAVRPSRPNRPPGAHRPGGNRPGANRPGGGNRPGGNRPGGGGGGSRPDRSGGGNN